MLSICIPVYNYDVGKLVADLHCQLEKAGCPYEIILMDDASDQPYRQKNKALESNTIRYIQLEENTGRSRIRNRLAAEARYPYLIFMDCDSGVSSEHYICDYMACCQPMVVCYGGRTYEAEKPQDDTCLRWKYGIERESYPAAVRQAQANFSFCTNNFLIDRQVFGQVSFDEGLQGYGHEDTLFGLELLAQGITIKHIDNPLVHLGLESAADFMRKTENGVRNLYRIDEILSRQYPEYAGHSKLVRTRNRLQKLGLVKLTALLFGATQKAMKKNLLGRNPSLRLMDLYKLGLLCRITAGEK